MVEQLPESVASALEGVKALPLEQRAHAYEALCKRLTALVDDDQPQRLVD